MHATVNREACIRCGLCPNLCPAVFSLQEGESAQAIAGELPEAALAAAQEAADNCPTGAIQLNP